MNIEGLYSACRELLCRTVYFRKKTEQADSAKNAMEAGGETTILTFCGSLFPIFTRATLGRGIPNWARGLFPREAQG